MSQGAPRSLGGGGGVGTRNVVDSYRSSLAVAPTGWYRHAFAVYSVPKCCFFVVGSALFALAFLVSTGFGKHAHTNPVFLFFGGGACPAVGAVAWVYPFGVDPEGRGLYSSIFFDRWGSGRPRFRAWARLSFRGLRETCQRRVLADARSFGPFGASHLFVLLVAPSGAKQGPLSGHPL